MHTFSGASVQSLESPRASNVEKHIICARPSLSCPSHVPTLEEGRPSEDWRGEAQAGGGGIESISDNEEL